MASRQVCAPRLSTPSPRTVHWPRTEARPPPWTRHSWTSQDASLLYLTSFVLTSQPRIGAAEELAARVCGHGGTIAVNLSSVAILGKVRGPLLGLLPRCRYAFGNTAELRALAALLAWPKGADELGDGAAVARLAELLAPGGVAVVTAGAGATLAAKQGEPVLTFPTPKVSTDEIQDTNGAGDAFVGGFLAKSLTEGAPLAACVHAGHHCAGLVLRRRGCDVRGLSRLEGQEHAS